MKIYDLSLPFSENTLVFPGTPPMKYEHTHTYEKNHYNLGLFSINTHAGTHTDAPLHFIDRATCLADVDVSKYIGPAVVIDCTAKKAMEMIGIADVEAYKDKIVDHRRVIFKTGWSRHYNEQKFFTDYPSISIELATWLADNGVVMIGVEAPSLNPGDYIEVHQILLGSGIAIVEGLTNLDELPSEEIFFVGPPLNVKDGDGFPIRALAIEF